MFVQIYDIQFTIYSSTVCLSIEGPNDPTASFIDDDYKAICAEGQRRCGVRVQVGVKCGGCGDGYGTKGRGCVFIVFILTLIRVHTALQRMWFISYL